MGCLRGGDVVIEEEYQSFGEAIVSAVYTASGGTVPLPAWYGGVGRPYREEPRCKVYGNKALITQGFGWDC